MEKIFNYPFAKDGDRNTELPNANAQDNSVSMQSGWTLPYELNPANGGKYIERKDMNEILFRAFDGINQVAEAVDKWIALTTENLNDIKQTGRYFQNLTINATNEQNYPANLAGYLIVLNNRINLYGVTQIYKIWNSERIYIRRTTSATAWSAWDSLTLTTELNSAVTQLQNSINQKETKTHYSLQYNPTLNAVKDNRFYAHGTNYTNAFNTQTNYIFNIGAEDGGWVRQISFPCASNEIGVRRITTKNNMNSWSAWDSLMLTSTANSTYRKIADSYTKAQCDSTFLTKTLASSTYRTIADSYTKAQCDSTFLTIANANSTYRKIADSYTKAEVDNKLIGINQSWQKPSRSNNTQYTNNTGKPIMVAITFKSANEHANGTCDFYVNNLIIASEDQRYIHIGRHTFSFIVPNGATYKVNCTGDFSIYLWAELR